VGLQNSGGIRAAVDAGPITYGELYDVMPFGNAMAKLTLSGSQLLTMLELGSRGEHGLTQVSGVRLVVDRALLDCPGTSHLVSATLSDGTPLRADAEYTIALSDYLAGGGGGYEPLTTTLPKGAVSIQADRLLRDVVAEHLRALGAPVDSAARPLVKVDEPRIVIRNANGPQRCPTP